MRQMRHPASSQAKESAMSEFLRWFEAQHGNRPSNLPTHQLRNLYVMADNRAKDALSLLEACELYDAKAQSALYAWNARGFI